MGRKCNLSSSPHAKDSAKNSNNRMVSEQGFPLKCLTNFQCKCSHNRKRLRRKQFLVTKNINGSYFADDICICLRLKQMKQKTEINLWHLNDIYNQKRKTFLIFFSKKSMRWKRFEKKVIIRNPIVLSFT